MTTVNMRRIMAYVDGLEGAHWVVPVNDETQPLIDEIARLTFENDYLRRICNESLHGPIVQTGPK